MAASCRTRPVFARACRFGEIAGGSMVNVQKVGGAAGWVRRRIGCACAICGGKDTACPEVVISKIKMKHLSLIVRCVRLAAFVNELSARRVRIDCDTKTVDAALSKKNF